jgi:predicted nuclease of predicted toxin-antitoxin system
MRFIVDESTGAAVVQYLREQGHDVLAVAEVMPQADDKDILERAAMDSRVLITNDKDFGELVFRLDLTSVGVILLRLRDESSANRVETVRFVLERFGDRLINHFIVVTERTVRIRPLLPPPFRPDRL